MEALGLPDAIYAEVDVTDREALTGAISEAVDRFGPPDLLVKNAGIMPLGNIRDQDSAEWQQVFDVNCVALLNVTQEVLPLMLEAGRGTIVNVGSVAGRNLYPNHLAYCGTKFAVHAMSEQLRKDLAPTNIRVAVIAPGMVETELLEGTSSEAIKSEYSSYKEQIGGALDVGQVAKSISVNYRMPQEVCVREIVLAPTRQDA